MQECFVLIVLLGMWFTTGSTQSSNCVPQCSYGDWSSWTKCSQDCNGTQWRRKLCTCTSANGCDTTYSDNLCLGSPPTETQSCSTFPGNYGCCHWKFTDTWSPCDKCCGGGQQWRRQSCFCLSSTGVELPSEPAACQFQAMPQDEFRPCNEDACCQLTSTTGCPYTNLKCLREMSDVRCSCGSLSACPAPAANPFRIVNTSCYDKPASEGTVPIHCSVLSGINYNTCVEFTPWSRTPYDIVYINPPACTVNPLASCYENGGWEVSDCCGDSCSTGRRWQIQKRNTYTTDCYAPPEVIIESCTPDGCCPLSTQQPTWSPCNSTTSPGYHWRAPTCTCGDPTLCPHSAIETQRCFPVGQCDWNSFGSITFCNASSSTGSQIITPSCICPSGTSVCDVSNCIGVPPVFPIADCTLPSSCFCAWEENTTSCIGDCYTIPPTPSPTPSPKSVYYAKADDEDKDDDEDDEDENEDDDDEDEDEEKEVEGEYYHYRIPTPPPVTLIQHKPNPTIGNRTITRTCVCNGVPSAASNCPALNLPLKQIVPCYLDCSCGLEEWSSWSKCSQCPGTHTRTRTCSCDTLVLSNGTSLPNPFNQSDPCNGQNLTQTESCVSTSICPRTAKQWKEAYPNWPPGTSSLTLFPCSPYTYATIIALNQPHDKWDVLAIDYVATKLNIVNGIRPSAKVQYALDNIRSVLAPCRPWGPREEEEIPFSIYVLRYFNRHGRAPRSH